MIGPLEILIVLVILLIVFGGYRALPRLGRSAGKGVREGSDKARQLAAKASERAERIDTDRISRSAGEGMREVRELHQAVTGGAQKPSSPAGTDRGTDSPEAADEESPD